MADDKRKKTTKDVTIAEVLKKNPRSAGIFFAHGMPCLGCSIALSESVEAAALTHGIDLQELLDELNEE